MRYKTSQFIQRLSLALNRNTGWLLAAAIVFFGLYNVAFSKENQILIKNTNSAAQSSEQAAKDAKAAAEDTKRILEGQGRAVAELKAHAEKQTELIICMLAIHGETTAISQTDQETCRVKVEQAQNDPMFGGPNQPAQTQSAPQSSQSQAPSTPSGESEGTPPRSFLERTILDPVGDFVSPVLNLIGID